MLRHYLKIAVRNLLANKWISLINIGGLSLGMACAILILFYLKNELSYDDFHKKKDHLFQLACTRTEQDGTSERFAIAALVQGPAFKQGIPEITEAVRVFPRDVIIRNQDHLFNESATWVDPAFFKIFTFPLVSGDPAGALSDHHKMVLTETTALKYFGTANAVGRQLLLEINGHFEPFVVSGVAQDPPPNSTIRFKILLDFDYYQQLNPDNGWMWVSFPTWFLLSPNADTAAVNRKMQQIYQLNAHDEIDLNILAGYHNSFHWKVLPIKGMHFETDYKGVPDSSDPVYAFLLAGIGLFVLLIAGINFVNLTIAQSLKRSREIGVRKVIGSSRKQLITQFLGESVAACGLALGGAIVLAGIALPAFGAMAGRHLTLANGFDLHLVIQLILLMLITGILAGAWPAFLLSGFSPTQVLTGKPLKAGKNDLARILVVIQFILATVLITSTVFLYGQFRLLTTTATGYDDKHLLSFTIAEGVRDKRLMDYYRSELSAVHGVINTSYQNIGKFGGKTMVNGKEFTATYVRMDNNYPATLGVPLAKGRSFSSSYPSDSLSSALVNETFVLRAGLNDPIGKTIDYLNLPAWGARKLTIVGVLRDFHYSSLKTPIEPMIFLQDNALPLGKMILKLDPAKIPATLLALDKTIHRLDPNHPFSYEFADETNQKTYEPEHRWGQIIASGAVITILIAITGLFGLSLLIIQKRRKEISIRKVLGSPTSQLVVLVTRDFGRLVLLAFLLSIPLSYAALHRWLEGYPYRIPLSAGPFLLVGTTTLIIALLTVSWHAIRTARANPVEALKNE